MPAHDDPMTLSPPPTAPANATSPFSMPWRGWLAAAHRTAGAMRSDRVALAAAGCAFWGTLALFPALSMLVLIYGLVFDPRTVLPQLELLRGVIPDAAHLLISRSLHLLLAKRHTHLGLGIALSTLVTLWGAATGARALLGALNLAYSTRERRGFLRFHITALVLTLGGLVVVAGAIAVVVLLPTGLSLAHRLGLGTHATQLRVARLIGHVTMLLAAPSLLALLYRHGPARPRVGWVWAVPGALIAATIWFAASLLFSFYLGGIARRDLTYGPLGAVAGLMLWLWVTNYAVLLGAELNAALERQAREADDRKATLDSAQSGHQADTSLEPDIEPRHPPIPGRQPRPGLAGLRLQDLRRVLAAAWRRRFQQEL